MKEPHKVRPAREHHHGVLKCVKGTKHRLMLFKLAMRRRHGLATHWITSKTEFMGIETDNSDFKYIRVADNKLRFSFCLVAQRLGLVRLEL